MCRIAGHLSAYDNKLELLTPKMDAAESKRMAAALVGTLSAERLANALNKKGTKFDTIKVASGDAVTLKIVSVAL